MASIERIKGSNGSGNANLATVQNLRSPGASTIVVDTVLDINPAGFIATMGTPHTFTDPITSESIIVISEATAVDFAGHIDGSNIAIDTIAPGYTDAGSKVGDIIIIRPTTQYADNLASVLGAAHNDNGTLKDNSVTAGVIADDGIDSADLFTDSVDPVKRASELMFDHVASGCILTGTSYGSTLAWSLSAGVVYINGKRLTYAGGTGSVSSTKDTYFDLLDNGDGTAVLVNTGGNIVTVNAASPALAANSVRIAIIQSGANIASVAAINQGQENKLLPIASSTPYAVTDSLGNLIYPRDPNRKTLGYRQILSTFSAGTNAETDVTGLSVPVKVPTGRKIKVSFSGSLQYSSGTARGTYAHIREGSTELTIGRTYAGAAAVPFSSTPWTEFTPSAGDHTYKISAECDSGANVSVYAAANEPAAIRVELV